MFYVRFSDLLSNCCRIKIALNFLKMKTTEKALTPEKKNVDLVAGFLIKPLLRYSEKV